MSFASRHNKGSRFTVDTTGFSFARIAELYTQNPDAVYRVAALYINTKGRFDDHPVAVLPDQKLLVDLPTHMTEETRAILANDEDCADIEAGRVGLKLEKYISKTYNREAIGCRWVDLSPAGDRLNEAAGGAR